MTRVAALLERIVKGCGEIFGESLTGVYLHGSLTFGCFCWETGDVDLLVVCRGEPEVAQKEALLSLLLGLEAVAPPKGIELSLMREGECGVFRHPMPYDFHLSPAHRTRALRDPHLFCETMRGLDADLTAHIRALQERGRTLAGRPHGEVFAPVPDAAFAESLRWDLDDAVERIAEQPVYTVLNLCRALAWLRERRFLSKREGAAWALERLTGVDAPLIVWAARCYETGEAFPAGVEERLRGFAAELLRWCEAAWR